jgi:hypothetical protein
LIYVQNAFFMAQSKTPKVDYDGLFKDFVTNRFQDFLAFAIPELEEQVDWQQPPEFLEQELINALRGKYKELGKRRHTDKLVKVSLHSGEARLVYIHVEFQHQPETNFARRMFSYMLRIILKYNTYNIEAVAIFTGAPPSASALIYEHKGFRTKSIYEFASIVAIHQDEAALIASKNSFSLALLAAKYAYEARGDQGRLFALKRKVLELCLKSGVDKDVIMRTFIFVKEFMMLPEKTERLLEQELEEFMGTTTKPQIKVSEGTKRFAERIYAAAHEGKLPSEIIKEERQRAEEERQRAEEERQRAEEEVAIRIAEERRRLEEAVVRLYSQFAMPAEQVAVAMNLPPIAIEDILRRYGHK